MNKGWRETCCVVQIALSDVILNSISIANGSWKYMEVSCRSIGNSAGVSQGGSNRWSSHEWRHSKLFLHHPLSSSAIVSRIMHRRLLIGQLLVKIKYDGHRKWGRNSILGIKSYHNGRLICLLLPFHSSMVSGIRWGRDHCWTVQTGAKYERKFRYRRNRSYENNYSN